MTQATTVQQVHGKLDQSPPGQSIDHSYYIHVQDRHIVSRYFIVKPSAGSLAALEAAMSHAAGVWSFPPPTERKLTAAVAASNVVVLFSVSGGGAFQGCALFSGQTATEGSRSGVRTEHYIFLFLQT